MLTATGQNQEISHGLQIGKDQDDSSQDAKHGFQYNNIGFIENFSIFAETPGGMQTLLDLVQEFTARCVLLCFINPILENCYCPGVLSCQQWHGDRRMKIRRLSARSTYENTSIIGWCEKAWNFARVFSSPVPK